MTLSHETTPRLVAEGDREVDLQKLNLDSVIKEMIGVRCSPGKQPG
jgi:hypothetical protein